MVSTATEALTLEPDAFARMVTQDGLRTTDIGGYQYAGRQGKNGWELYKTQLKRRFFWSFRQVCTQDNAAGGNLVATITPPANSSLAHAYGYILASGNRAANIEVFNADGTRVAFVAQVGAVASATAIFAGAPSTNTTSAGSQEVHNKTVANPSYLVATVVAAAQTETASLVINAELSSPTAPTVSWATSGGTPNAATATENTVTEVPCLS